MAVDVVTQCSHGGLVSLVSDGTATACNVGVPNTSRVLLRPSRLQSDSPATTIPPTSQEKEAPTGQSCDQVIRAIGVFIGNTPIKNTLDAKPSLIFSTAKPSLLTTVVLSLHILRCHGIVHRLRFLHLSLLNASVLAAAPPLRVG